MTDFDDFDWVDSTSGQRRREDSPSGVNDSREYARPRSAGPSNRPTGLARSQSPSRATQARGPARSGAAPRSGDSSGGGNGARPPRTIWSQIEGGSRRLSKKITAIPRPVLMVISAFIFFIILTMVIDSAAYYNKVHTGVSVAQQGLGGKTYDQALSLVNQKVEELQTQPITLVSGTRTWTITPDDVGQLIDVDASVNAAMQVTRRSNFVADLARRFRLYFNGDNLALVGELDQEKFDAFVAEVAGELDIKPVNMGLSPQGDTIAVVKGVSGFVVNQDKLKAQLMEALFTHGLSQIQVPMMTKAPDVLADSTDEAVAQVQTMLSGNVQLAYYAPPPTVTVTTTPADTSGKTTATTAPQTTATTAPQTTATTVPQTTTTTIIVKTSAGDKPFIYKTKTFSPAEIQNYLDYKAEDRDGVKVLVPYISADKMRPFFSKIEGPMTVPAANAYFKTDGSSPWTMSGKEGKGLDPEATAAALTAAALKTADRSATALLRDIEPEFTTEEANAMGITRNLGEATTYWPNGTDDREHNVRFATEKIINKDGDPGKLLGPGEEFDFAKMLGPRTEEAGFKPAPGIVDGAIEDDVLGGGICQVSTTFFNALLTSGLKITERWNHSIYITHYPRGMDATITGGGKPKNLKFVNDTPNYIWIWGYSDGVTTQFVIFGTPDDRQAKMTVSDPYDVTKMSGSTITTLDPNLPWGSTSVAFDGQDGFKLKLTRVISWPNGSTTSETWVSRWAVKTKVVAFPTSTTLMTAPKSPTTATTLAGPPGS